MLTSHIEAILLVTGLLTAGALVAFVAPVAAMKLLFGQEPSGLLGENVARHWGLLIFCIGVLLIYAAFHAEIRAPIVAVAILEKVVLAIIVLGTPLRRSRTATVVAVTDSAIAVIYALYLAGR